MATRKENYTKLREWVKKQSWYKPEKENEDIRKVVAERLKANK